MEGLVHLFLQSQGGWSVESSQWSADPTNICIHIRSMMYVCTYVYTCVHMHMHTYICTSVL